MPCSLAQYLSVNPMRFLQSSSDDSSHNTIPALQEKSFLFDPLTNVFTESRKPCEHFHPIRHLQQLPTFFGLDGSSRFISISGNSTDSAISMAAVKCPPINQIRHSTFTIRRCLKGLPGTVRKQFNLDSHSSLPSD